MQQIEERFHDRGIQEENLIQEEMKLPNAEYALVEQSKIVDYLLALDHRDGSSKANFLLRFGFNREHWQILAQALRVHGASYAVSSVTDTPHGPMFTVDGILVTPDGRNPVMRSVWIIDLGNDFPRLVTAYPSER